MIKKKTLIHNLLDTTPAVFKMPTTGLGYLMGGKKDKDSHFSEMFSSVLGFSQLSTETDTERLHET